MRLRFVVYDDSNENFPFKLKAVLFTERNTSILKVIRQAITRLSNQDFTFIPRTCAFVAIASIHNGRRYSALTHIFMWYKLNVGIEITKHPSHFLRTQFTIEDTALQNNITLKFSAHAYQIKLAHAIYVDNKLTNL